MVFATAAALVVIICCEPATGMQELAGLLVMRTGAGRWEPIVACHTRLADRPRLKASCPITVCEQLGNFSLSKSDGLLAETEGFEPSIRF